MLKEIEKANKNIYVSKELEKELFLKSEKEEFTCRFFYDLKNFKSFPVLAYSKSFKKIKLTLCVLLKDLIEIKLDTVNKIEILCDKYNFKNYYLEYKIKKNKEESNYIINIVLKEKEKKRGI